MQCHLHSLAQRRACDKRSIGADEARLGLACSLPERCLQQDCPILLRSTIRNQHLGRAQERAGAPRLRDPPRLSAMAVSALGGALYRRGVIAWATRQCRGVAGLAPLDESTVLNSCGVEPFSDSFRRNKEQMDGLIAQLDAGGLALPLLPPPAAIQAPAPRYPPASSLFRGPPVLVCPPCRHCARAAGRGPQSGAAAPPARQAAAQVHGATAQSRGRHSRSHSCNHSCAYLFSA